MSYYYYFILLLLLLILLLCLINHNFNFSLICLNSVNFSKLEILILLIWFWNLIIPPILIFSFWFSQKLAIVSVSAWNLVLEALYLEFGHLFYSFLTGLVRGKVKHKVRVTSYEFKSTSYEIRFTSYKFKSTRY